MLKSKFTCDQRRRMRKLDDRLDSITQADLNYFERFPHRRHRVRVTGRAETEQAELLGADISLPSGKQHYMAIRRSGPLGCFRIPMTGPAKAQPELFDEELAQAIFEGAASELCVPLELMLECIKERK